VITELIDDDRLADLLAGVEQRRVVPAENVLQVPSRADALAAFGG